MFSFEHDFTYDQNGNMITDQNKGITNISYNHLNLPTQVTLGGQNINYVYDASGVKLRKTVQGVTTDYAGNYIYENNTLQFFNHPEGYVKKDGSAFNYVYQYKDHLGNVRLSYADTDNNGSINTSTEIIEESNYYPFGLKHKGYNNVTSPNGNSVAQKFKYNGIEYEQSLGLDLYEMNVRMYNPALGRFQGIDPVTHHSFGTSVAFDNNPIFWADPSGADATTGGADWSGFNLGPGREYFLNKETNPDDIIFQNKEGETIAKILTNSKKNTYITVDTDITLPSPIEIDAKGKNPFDAVGINFDWSWSVGGGLHGGFGFVYFLNGKNSKELYGYKFKGGNVGVGEGFGLNGYLSYFNRDLDNSLNSLETFKGNYNGYEGSYLIGGYTYSWSNRKNTSDQFYPGYGATKDNNWTWKNRSLDANYSFFSKNKIKVSFKGFPRLQAKYFGGETYDFRQIRIYE